MSINLLNIAKGYLTNAVVEKLSGAVGENTLTTKNALEGILPTVLGGIVNKSSEQGGIGTILELLKSGNHDGNILDNLSGFLDGDKSAILSAGSGIISSLFGNGTKGVVDAISSYSGIKKESSSSLMGMVAPILMGVLGKQVTSGGLGASGLISLLSSQKDSIKAALPTGLSGLGSVLGIGTDNIGKTVSNAASTAYTKVEEAVEETSSSGTPSWLLPILGLILAGGLLWYFMKGCNSEKTTEVAISADSTVAVVEAATDSTVHAIGAAADSAGSAVANAVSGAVADLGAFFKRKLPDGIELNIPENGVENKLISFIEDKSKAVDKTTWFSFDRLEFETGKSTLKPASQEQLKNIASILKAFPNVNIKLGGYTDNTGDAKANVKLSQERAATTLNEIVKLGIAKSRLEAEGYGDQHPIADNATAEGRQKNRRIDIRVTKK